jgi:zinc transporter ZupT
VLLGVIAGFTIYLGPPVGMTIAAAIGLHNFAEGLAIGVSAKSGARVTSSPPTATRTSVSPPRL